MFFITALLKLKNMAKAKEITGLDCEANVLEWADKILRVRFEEIMEKRGAALESADIKAVHDMRVATRRMRSALRDFAPLMKTKPLKKLKNNSKRIADSLGAVRDLDVEIIALEKLGEKARVKSIKKGIDELIGECRQLREQAHLNFRETMPETALDDLRKRFDKKISKAAEVKKSAKVISFTQAGSRVVGKSVREFCDLSDHIYEPFIDKPLHELRIAAKRLRYSIELYTGCWGERIAPFADEIAEMQNYLGEVHDADVWLETLSENLRDSKGDFRTNIWLLSEFVAQRTKNYRAALKLWSSWQDNNFIENLKSVVLSNS